MRKRGSERCFRGCFFTVSLLLVSCVFSQDAVSLNRQKPPRQPLHAGVATPATDTTIARQPLFSILKQLNQSKGIFFLFSEKSFGDILVKPVANKNLPVEQILEDLLQFTGLNYKKVNDKTFVIIAALQNTTVHKPTIEESKNTAEKKAQLVKGRVTNEEGKPLANVSVSVRGTSIGTATNAEGEFNIGGTKGEVLELSSVGYEKKVIPLNSSSPIIYLNAQLSVLENMMNEVVVTALGVNK
jgi:iron complex outermembrane receptor protein